jgi:hypothetical protein
MLKTYGVKSFKAENTYLQFSSSVTDKNEIIDLNQQSAQDLKIMTEATMLNPFLKKGTMTLSNIYNLKRGVGIVIPELNMFYYVESYNYNCTPGKITVNVNISFGLPTDKIDFFFDMIKMEPNKKTNKLDITYNHERFEQLRKKDY